MACKVSLQSLLATLIAISVANNGNGSAQVAGRCIAYVRPATRIPSALLHVVPMPAWEQRELVDIAEIVGGWHSRYEQFKLLGWRSRLVWLQLNWATTYMRKAALAKSLRRDLIAVLLRCCRLIRRFFSPAVRALETLQYCVNSACTNQGFQSLVIGDADVYFVYSMSERIKEVGRGKSLRIDIPGNIG